MLKIINSIKYTFFSITAIFLLLLVYSFYSLPDEIHSVSDQDIRVNYFCTVSYSDTDIMNMKKSASAGTYQVQLRLFNAIPVKTSSLTVSERQYVALSGEIIGLRLFTNGVMIVGVDTVKTKNGAVSPGAIAGLQKGDVLVKIDGTEIKSSKLVNEILSKSEGKALKIEYIRNNQSFVTDFSCVYSESEGRFKGGLWIRDSAAGIGTMTFYDPESGGFAALGHAVCDIDTGEILPFENGDIVRATINSCTKGVNGKAGELCGVFTGESIGVLLKNTGSGVFGVLNEREKNVKLVPVATKQEIKKGAAQIISTVEGEKKELFDIQITEISDSDSNRRNMVIEVTDEELMEKTGGIVQGMSGSPIIQNGKLVGAVTHVLVNDPTKGYAIFAQKMLDAA